MTIIQKIISDMSQVIQHRPPLDLGITPFMKPNQPMSFVLA